MRKTIAALTILLLMSLCTFRSEEKGEVSFIYNLGGEISSSDEKVVGMKISTVFLDSIITAFLAETYDIKRKASGPHPSPFVISIDIQSVSDTTELVLYYQYNLICLLTNGVVGFHLHDSIYCAITFRSLMDIIELPGEYLNPFFDQMFPNILQYYQGKVIDITTQGDTIILDWPPITYHTIYWKCKIHNGKLVKKTINDEINMETKVIYY